MMRVCWFSGTRYSQPLDATQAKKWEALAGLNVEITVIGYSADVRFRRFDEYAHFILLPNLPGTLLRYLVALIASSLIAFWLALRGRANVFVAQSPYEGASAALVKRLARLCGRKVALIVESHGDFEGSFFLYRRLPFTSLLRRLMRVVSRFSLSQADVLRAVSSPTCAQLARRTPGKPLEQFMTWTDVEVFYAVSRSEPLSSSHTLVFAGMLVPLKGVHILLDAFAHVAALVPSARLLIVGRPQNAAYSAQLREQTTALKLDDRVTFVGAVTQQALSEYLSAARALVLPSFSEGLPRVLVEAMATGIPVVATTVGGIPDVVQDGHNGYLVPPGDVDALAEALREILNHPHIDVLGRQARARAQTLFSPQAYVAGYQRLFALASEALR